MRKGIILDEPSMMAFRADTGRRPKLVVVGHEARALLGRSPAGLVVTRPLQDGVVIDLEIAQRFLRAILFEGLS